MKIGLKSFQFCSLTAVKSIKNFIINETKITQNHLTPEIKLRLITENCRLFHSTGDELNSMPFTDPFWGFYWPGGQATSRYILDNPRIVKGKKILDFGSGCAASSIAARLSSCSFVVANDIDETAEIAAQLNAEMNKVQIVSDTRNLINHPFTFDFDVVLLGDVFYDESFAAQLLPWIKNLHANNQTCLIGDPGRHALCKELNLQLLARYELPENVCIENHGFKFTNVFKVS